MKRKLLTNLLKGLTVGAVLLGLYICASILPDCVWLMVAIYPAMGAYANIAIAYCWLVALPIFVALVPAWQIFDSVGHDESFSEANARRLKWIHWLALADFVLVAVGYVLCSQVVRGSPMLIFCCVTGGFLCLAVSVACLVLSQLIYQATLIQQENEFTV